MSKEESDEETPSPVLPAVLACTATGLLSLGFGFGAGWRGFRESQVYADLIEKFPDEPTKQAEAMARRSATRALIAGTGITAVLGAASIAVARSYGIKSVEDFGEEARRWLPTRTRMEDGMAKYEPLQRHISENLQSARDVVGKGFRQSSIGTYLGDKAKKSAGKHEQEEWEKDLVKKIESPDFGEK